MNLMRIIFFIGVVVVLYNIYTIIYKRKVTENSLKIRMTLKVNTYISFINIIYGVLLSILTYSLLYDNVNKNIDIYSLLTSMIIIIFVLLKTAIQYLFTPIFIDTGIVFYNGLLLQWNDINEVNTIENKKNGDCILFIGGKVNSKMILREKILVNKDDLVKVESMLLSKTNIK